MKLRTRLFLLFLASGVLPLCIVILAGLLSLRQQSGLWNLPTVDAALEASVRTNRGLLNRSLRDLEDVGLEAAAALAREVDSPGVSSRLDELGSAPGVDFAAFFTPTPSGWGLVAATEPISARALGERIPKPAASAEGPQRSRPIQWTDGATELLVVPTFVWSDPGAPGLPVLAPRGCLLLGTRLGNGTFADLARLTDALVNYRRFGELGSLLAVAQLLVLAAAFVASLGISGLLARSVARRISTPVEHLVEVLTAVGSRQPAPALGTANIPEVVRISTAVAEMRARLTEYEDQARETERVAASQETARFVAHEIRNALTPVTAGIAVLERRVEALPEESRPQGRRALEAIRREAERMAALAASFSEYAHLPAPRPTWVDPATILAEIARDAPEGVMVNVDLPNQHFPIFIDRDELERLLRNLVKNACEAMAGQGRLDLSLRYEAGRVLLEVRDDGPGMDDQTLRHALQPGFTTKDGGSGLGLSLVRGAVIRYGGKLELESTPGRGTVVRIRLPLEPAPSPAGGNEAGLGAGPPFGKKTSPGDRGGARTREREGER